MHSEQYLPASARPEAHIGINPKSCGCRRLRAKRGPPAFSMLPRWSQELDERAHSSPLCPIPATTEPRYAFALANGLRRSEAMIKRHYKDLLRTIADREDTRPGLPVWGFRLAFVAAVFVIPQSSAIHGSDMAELPGEQASPAHIMGPFVTSVAAVRARIRGDALARTVEAPPAAAFAFQGSATDRARAIECLAATAWYEAGADPAGQRSVMQVVLNRVNHPAFPKSVCGVVFQGSQRTTGCQFTFTCDGSLLRRRPSAAALHAARTLAAAALDGAVDESVGRATHYHADYVAPRWRLEMRTLGIVGRHIFYSWGGMRGALSTAGNSGPEADFVTLAARTPPAIPRIGGTAEAFSSDSGPPGAAQAFAAPVPGGTVAQTATLALPVTSAQFLTVDLGGASGRWAVEALGRCAGRQGCQVLGYPSSELVERNRAVLAPERDRPAFVFVRDRASGMEVALWDCARVARPDKNECLPEDRDRLIKIMRERMS